MVGPNQYGDSWKAGFGLFLAISGLLKHSWWLMKARWHLEICWIFWMFKVHPIDLKWSPRPFRSGMRKNTLINSTCGMYVGASIWSNGLWTTVQLHCSLQLRHFSNINGLEVPNEDHFRPFKSFNSSNVNDVDFLILYLNHLSLWYKLQAAGVRWAPPRVNGTPPRKPPMWGAHAELVKANRFWHRMSNYDKHPSAAAVCGDTGKKMQKIKIYHARHVCKTSHVYIWLRFESFKVIQSHCVFIWKKKNKQTKTLYAFSWCFKIFSKTYVFK